MKPVLIAALIVLILVPPAAAQESKANKTIRFSLSTSFVGLSAADTLTTIYGTKRGNIETNGLLRPLIERREYAAIWAIQIAGTAAILLLLNPLMREKKNGAMIAGYAMMAICILVRGYCVIHNARLNAKLN